jgi:hypothetical protein
MYRVLYNRNKVTSYLTKFQSISMEQSYSWEDNSVSNFTAS